ncbi:hypothetical protein [uncultured Aliiroseovarius sp.]|uniref:hypothetical protein n=1 Tax=uncultured Aliiroseovarius sp. TaxID=1658783 RepID=UPI0026300246|nr:hypothetical protein [uncultured Aliiroseovarius sp.]
MSDHAQPKLEMATLNRRLRRSHQIVADLHAEIVRFHGPILPRGKNGDQYVPVVFEKAPSAKGTIFSFAGLQAHGDRTDIEFGGLLAGIPYCKVYVKDYAQCWYQHGLEGLGSTRIEAFRALANAFKDLPRPWIAIGCSAGGYAALLAGAAMKADKVVAYCPQTHITRDVFVKFSQILPRSRNFKLRAPDNDLAHSLAELPPVPSDIHFGAKNETDASQAKRLGHLPQVALYSHPIGSHNIAGYLRMNDCLLSTILEP